ncbi:NAD(P)-binding protein [Schizopora paradoxa]|uniref:NAD(P)-binding protein n=1 Tax=Schizopora paradoxa TaxID=27342 RepID=A0A0H2RAE0_9AGAM|nr:NAD(P)-binding protein [Schizopora paradoxa]
MVESDKPLIVVTGATGAQGGSAVKFCLKTEDKTARNLPYFLSPDLKSKGVEVVQADYDDFDSLLEGFKGADGAFLLTNFWDPTVFDEEREFITGKALVDAAKQSGVGHVVYSAIEQSLETLKAAHFDSKFRVNNYLIESGLNRTSIYTPCYFENFINNDPFKLRKDSDGSTVLAHWPLLWTDGPIPGYSADRNHTGRDIKIISEIFTPRQYVTYLKEFAPAGVEIKYKETSFEEFDALRNETGFMKEMHANRSDEEVAVAGSLYPERISLRDFVKNHIGELLPH